MTNPTFGQLTFTTGVANSTTITWNAGAYDFSTTKYVTLSHSYARVMPPGMPDPNPGNLSAPEYTQYPQTIPSGQRVQFYTPEANALIAAGAGVAS